MALTSTQWRDERIERLTRTLMAMRPARRLGDAALASIIENELTILQAVKSGDETGIPAGRWLWSTSPAFGACRSSYRKAS
jgi:hypothetical protein